MNATATKTAPTAKVWTEAVLREPRVPNRSPLRIGRAYEGFLGLPVPLVLMALWLLGALMLGAVVIGAYSAEVWLSAAIAPLL